MPYSLRDFLLSCSSFGMPARQVSHLNRDDDVPETIPCAGMDVIDGSSDEPEVAPKFDSSPLKRQPLILGG